MSKSIEILNLLNYQISQLLNENPFAAVIQSFSPPLAQSSSTHPSTSRTAQEIATVRRPTTPDSDHNALQSEAHPRPRPLTRAPSVQLCRAGPSRATDRPSSVDAIACE